MLSLGAKQVCEDYYDDYFTPEEKDKWTNNRIFSYHNDGITYYVWLVDDVEFIRDAFNELGIPHTNVVETIYEFISFYIMAYYDVFVTGAQEKITVDDINNESDIEKRKDLLIRRQTAIIKGYAKFKKDFRKPIDMTSGSIW
jgi:hypothetical protein